MKTSVTFALIATFAAACAPQLDDEIAPDGSEVGPEIDIDVPMDDDLPSASGFACSDAPDSAVECIDFNDGASPGVHVEGGEFAVVGGRFVGGGALIPEGTCGGDSLMSHAMVRGLSVRDVRVSMQMASVQRVDKVLALRSVDVGNRIQLNFRANDGDGLYGDLIVQQTRDCVGTMLTSEGEIPMPHDMNQKIDVIAELIGTRLTVHVDGVQIVDRDFAFLEDGGEVGMGVIDHSRTLFDDLVIEAL